MDLILNGFALATLVVMALFQSWRITRLEDKLFEYEQRFEDQKDYNRNLLVNVSNVRHRLDNKADRDQLKYDLKRILGEMYN